ncbi:hypothetical protein BCR39DRAFT_273539 [Naematelia encephala]|uniref:Uncharacterized protein n=1 Tax=Naematelia encephala TaxID=71784 RepID=A0A1Y2AU85_9TREE|nr:hypothetical protein BCR39DRAFT_273539 [Naematelia encephala]
MRVSSTIVLAALGSASAVVGQLSIPSSFMGLTFSAACQQAILGVLTTGPFAECTHFADVLPALVSNISVVPVLDKFMSDVCYSAACSNATLQQASTTILSGCASDLSGEGLPNSTVTTAFSTYPLVREILCLKTSDPYTNASYGGVLGNPPIPISSAYNTTGGVFCVTSLLTQLSAYFGTNLTIPFVETIVKGGNSTALKLAEGIQSNIICNGCIFGALDVVEEAYPGVGSVPISKIYGLLNRTSPVNTTINGFVNGTCAYVPLNATSNGTLPTNISVSIIDSTFPYNLTNGTTTFLPNATSV